MKESYSNRKLSSVTMQRVEEASSIIEEYRQKGYILTVRQIYYQFVSRNLLPNSQRSYRLVANALEKGRMTGLIDWTDIEDRTRFLRGNTHWEDPAEIIEASAQSFMLDSRATQSSRIEVWIEKDALIGVIEPPCRDSDVDFFSCRGYVSLSEMWRAARRFQYESRSCVIFHFGDHDPSGLDMTRVITDTLDTFGCTNVEVRRIALTMEQVEKYNLPPNFAKRSDTRSSGYISEYGGNSWELDALPPDVIHKLIVKNIKKLTDENKRRKIIDLQKEQRGKLEYVASHWEEL